MHFLGLSQQKSIFFSALLGGDMHYCGGSWGLHQELNPNSFIIEIFG
jgi:hypothetical protein